MARPKSLDQRKIRVGIYTPDGGIRYYEDPLDIYVNGEIVINQVKNHCTVKISNLATSELDYILTKTSPYNFLDPQRRQIQITVDVGRQSTGLRNLYTGFIFSSSVTPPPDVSVILECQLTFFGGAELIALSSAPNANIKQITQSIVNQFNQGVADQNKISLNFQSVAQTKVVNNFSFVGTKPAAFNALNQLGLDATLVGNTLYVRDKGMISGEIIPLITADTGMIGIPEITENGVIVKFFLDTAVTLGGGIKIQSNLYKAADGTYRIYKLGFEAATRDLPFYYIATCSRDFSTYGINS